MKNVAVIGAGPSGLATIKELLEAGFQVTCYEKAAGLGGVYRYDEKEISVYESTLLTSSAWLTSFSDFPPQKRVPPHFKHQEYLQYLKDYTGHFKLLPSIKFDHAVESVVRSSDGRWEVTVFDIKKNMREKNTFDAVAVCAGVHQNILRPNIPGIDSFRGEVSHSGRYKNADLFRNKKILIIGGGESGSDIVEEVAAVAQECSLSLRRGVMVIPRLIFGDPNDFYTTRSYYALPSWLLRKKQSEEFHGKKICLIALSVFFLILQLAVLGILASFFVSRYPLLEIFLMLSVQVILIFLLVVIIKFLIKDFKIKEVDIIVKLNRDSLAGHGEQFATKCQGMVRAIARKQCSLKPAIKRFYENGAEFVDGTRADIDAVILCTGYFTKFPFLNIDRMDCRSLYKNCFDSKLGSSLCFIGLARPAIGAIPPISEMQARWFARVLSGKCSLPSLEKMNKEIELDAIGHKTNFAVVSDRITGLVDYTSYMDGLADFIGCKPLFKDLLMNFDILFRIYALPFMACQYRLSGDLQKRKLAFATLRRVPLSLFRRIYGHFLLSMIIICEILYRFGFKDFKPNIRLWR